MHVALTADWIMKTGGAEQVIGAFIEAFPRAPLFVSVAGDLRGSPLAAADIRVSTLQPWYTFLGRHQPLLPWMPRAMERFDLRGYDVILSSSHAVGKGILPAPHTLHICYCHTPMRYAWFMQEDYLRDFHIPGILRPFVRRILDRLRTWDLASSKRVDLFLANSETTAARIRDIYGRQSIVLHPPVDDRFFAVPLRTSRETTYYIAVGRLVPYKRFDLLVEAANRGEFRLKIVGTGHDEARLKRMAGPTVEFLGRVANEDLPALYAGADALLLPQEEDAGIVVLEAQACGTPVVAFGKGGAVDLTAEHTSSLFFHEQTPASLLAALAQFSVREWDRAAIRARVRESTRANFTARIVELVTAADRAMDDGTFHRT